MNQKKLMHISTYDIDSGEILPVGGVREKILAANRIGIKRVILPTANQQNLVDIPKEDRENIEFIFCDCIQKVLENSLVQNFPL